jgi:hypothetical protein
MKLQRASNKILEYVTKRVFSNLWCPPIAISATTLDCGI